MNLSTIILISVVGAILLTFITVSIVTNVILNSIFVPESSGWKKSEHQDKLPLDADEETREIYRKKDALKRNAEHWVGMSTHEDLYITSFDGLKLHGLLYPSSASHKFAVLIHGYRGTARHSAIYGVDFFQKGYNVLLVESRGSGLSEGKAVTFGALEKKDVVKWCKKILEIDKDAEIVLHGESMGASTVMMASGENLPSSVKAIIADCGYTSVWDEFAYLLKKQGKRTFPILPLGSLYSKIRFGFGFKSTSTIKALTKSKTPVLIIHGGADTFVPTTMAKLNYVAIPCAKDWFIMPKADHGKSVVVDNEVYWSKVWEFLERNANA